MGNEATFLDIFEKNGDQGRELKGDFEKLMASISALETERIVSNPPELFLKGFWVSPIVAQDCALQLWMHQTGMLPSGVYFDYMEALKLASLIELAVAGVVSGGSFFLYRSRTTITVITRRRGAITIALPDRAFRSTFPRKHALAMASCLRSSAAKIC